MIEIRDGDQVVSIDFFDTVITRSCIDPKEVFRKIEHLTQIPGWAEKRVKAESTLRRELLADGREEVTLEEIHEYLADNACLEVEIEVETSSWVLNPEARRLFELCDSKGIEIIVISDIYLPSECLRIFLELNGLGERQVYASSELDLTKRSGSIFDFIKFSNNYDFLKWTHVGDNQQSDLDSPRWREIRAHLWNSVPAIMEEQLGRKNYAEPTEQWVSSKLSAITGLVKPPKTTTMGLRYLAPATASFIDWVSKEAKRENIDHLIFLGRDSWLFHEAFVQAEVSQISTSYFSVSRRAMMPLMNKEEIKFEIEKFRESTSKDIRQSLLVEWEPGIEKDPAFENLIQEILAEEPAVLKSELVRKIQNHDRVGIVDIGWHGTNYGLLARRFQSVKNGFFLGLYPEAHSDSSARGFLFDRSHGFEAAIRIRPGIEVLENLFSEPAPSVVKFMDVGENVREVFCVLDLALEASAHSLVEATHEATLSHLHLFSDSNVQKTADLLAELISNPTSQEAFLLGNLPASPLPGCGKPERLLDSKTKHKYWLPARSVLSSSEVHDRKASIMQRVLFFFWNKLPRTWRVQIGKAITNLIYGDKFAKARQVLPLSMRIAVGKLLGISPR
jgi:hypothetical protein